MLMYAKNVNQDWKANVVDQMQEDLEKFSKMRKEKKEKENVRVGLDRLLVA